MSVSVYATDYYVATDGKDMNVGSIEKPFATLSKALKLPHNNLLHKQKQTFHMHTPIRRTISLQMISYYKILIIKYKVTIRFVKAY